MAPSSDGRRRYTKEELIAYLKQLAAELNMVPTMRSLEALPGPSPQTYLAHWDTWRKALLAAGLVPPDLVAEDTEQRGARAVARRRHTNEDLVEMIREYVREHHGRVPTVVDFNAWAIGHPDYPNAITLAQRFGSWNRALQHAGYVASDSRVSRLPDIEAALAFLRTAIRELGHEPTVAEYNEWAQAQRDDALMAFEAEHGPKPDTEDTSSEAKIWRQVWREHLRHEVPVVARTLFRHFGSWPAAIAAARKPAATPTDQVQSGDAETLLRALDRLALQLNRVPTSTDVRTYAAAHRDFPRPSAYLRVFGNWSEVKRRLFSWRQQSGVEEQPAARSAEQQAIIRGIHELYRHLGRVPIAVDFSAAQRDPTLAHARIPSYEDILRTFGSWPKARRLWADTYHIAKTQRERTKHDG